MGSGWSAVLCWNTYPLQHTIPVSWLCNILSRYLVEALQHTIPVPWLCNILSRYLVEALQLLCERLHSVGECLNDDVLLCALVDDLLQRHLQLRMLLCCCLQLCALEFACECHDHDILLLAYLARLTGSMLNLGTIEGTACRGRGGGTLALLS